jgi:hypothetical protein
MSLASAGHAIFTRSTFAHLDRTDPDRRVVETTAFATRPPPYVSLVNLNRVFCAHRILVRSDHGGAQFMQQLEHGLITREAELALDLEGGHARRLGRYEKSRPEPRGERRPGLLHDGAGCQRRVTLALSTPRNRRTMTQAIRRTRPAAETTDEPFRPAQRFKVSRTVVFIRKQALPFQPRGREFKSVDHRC